MSPKPVSVEDFLATLAHPQADLIGQVRRLVSEAGPRLTEGIKWNAPSYALDGNDIITFNFRQFGGVALIFHTGPKGKDTQTGTRLFEPTVPGMRWLADKRFVLPLADTGFLETHRAEIAGLVGRWIGLAQVGFA